MELELVIFLNKESKCKKKYFSSSGGGGREGGRGVGGAGMFFLQRIQIYLFFILNLDSR